MDNINDEKKDKVYVLQHYFVRRMSPMIWAVLLTFFLVAIDYFFFKTGLNYLHILIGAILSVGGAFVYMLSEIKGHMSGRKSWFLAIGVLLGFLPYLFGVYMIIFAGILPLITLFYTFSFYILVQSLAFIYVGNVIVKTIYDLTEFAKRM